LLFIVGEVATEDDLSCWLSDLNKSKINCCCSTEFLREYFDLFSESFGDSFNNFNNILLLGVTSGWPIEFWLLLVLLLLFAWLFLLLVLLLLLLLFVLLDNSLDFELDPFNILNISCPLIFPSCEDIWFSL